MRKKKLPGPHILNASDDERPVGEISRVGTNRNIHRPLLNKVLLALGCGESQRKRIGNAPIFDLPKPSPSPGGAKVAEKKAQWDRKVSLGSATVEEEFPAKPVRR